MSQHRTIVKAINAIAEAGIELPANVKAAHEQSKRPVIIDTSAVDTAHQALIQASTDQEFATAVEDVRRAMALNAAAPDTVRASVRTTLERHLVEAFHPAADDLLVAIGDRFDQEAGPLADAIARIPGDIETRPVTALSPDDAQALQDATQAHGRVTPVYAAYAATYAALTGAQLGNTQTVKGATRSLASVAVFDDGEAYRDAVEWLIHGAANPVHAYGPVAAAVLYGGRVSLARSTDEVEARRHEVVEAGPPQYTF